MDHLAVELTRADTGRLTFTLKRSRVAGNFDHLPDHLKGAVRLVRGGVKITAARAAAGFVSDPERGDVLSFNDLGKWRLQGDTVEVRPNRTPAKRVQRPARAGTASFGDAALTPKQRGLRSVEGEAAVRHFQQGGYSREEAETAVHAARKYRARR